MNPVRPSGEGVLLDVRVVPNAKKEAAEYSDGVLKVKVKAPPEKGKANKDVLRVLSSLFGPCAIVRGHTSGRKTVLLSRCTPEKAAETLESLAKAR